MKAAKILNFLIPCAIAFGMVSCTPSLNLDIDEETKIHGIETDMQSAIIDVPVQAKGKWFAGIDENADWVSIVKPALEYNGPQTLRLAFDENRTGADRKTTLYFFDSKDEMTEVVVRQYYNFEGEAPTNGSGEAFSDKGLGCGIDYDYLLDTKSIKRRSALEDARVAAGTLKEEDRTQFEPTKVKKNNNIFNITRIEELIAASKIRRSSYTETIIELADLEAQMLDSALVQDKSADLKLTLKVAFGPITFSASADYKSAKSEDRAFIDYTIVRHAPMYNVVLSEAEIGAYAEDYMVSEMPSAEELKKQLADIAAMRQGYLDMNAAMGKEGLTAVQQKKINMMYDMIGRPTFDNVFSTAFSRLYWDLFSAVAEGDTDKADKIMNNIDNYYGPFFISGGDYGGAIVCHAQVDTLRMEGNATVTGDLQGGMQGMFQVTGKFTYTERGWDAMHNSNVKFYIYGGNANETASALWALTMGSSLNDAAKWEQAVRGWVDSMYSPTDKSPVMSKASPLSWQCVPVWTLFFDYDTQTYAQQWFLVHYADRGIYEYLGIMKGEKELTPEELYDEFPID